MSEPLIRAARPEDAAGCAAVYAPYVSGGVISFELEPPDGAEMLRRIESAHAWLVAEDDGEIVGYAYGGPHRERAAYRWTADVAVYLAEDGRGRGLGTQLYEELFAILRAQGMRMLCAGVTQPNPASDGLHRSLGFEEVGVYRDIGFKNGAWHDVRWYQLDLAAGDDAPPAGA